MSAEKLAEALRRLLDTFPIPVDGVEQADRVTLRVSLFNARAALAAHEAEAKAAPADWRELTRRLYVELWHCDQQMMSVKKYGKPVFQQGQTVRDVLADAKAALEAAPVNPSPTPAPLTDEQVAAALEAGGIGVQRFMGGIAGTKDCWSSQGSADIRKVAAVVRGLIANGGKP